MEHNKFLAFANVLADEAKIIAKKYFRNQSAKALNKSDNSPVTIADREIEERIRSLIKESYPKHSIFGEEMGETKGSSSYKWYIDPIDGTSSFITGKPLFTTLICLTCKGNPILSIIDQPILSERYIAITNEPAILNNGIIKTSKCTYLNEAKLSTTSPILFSEGEVKKFNLLRRKCDFQLYGGCFYGGDAYQYARLAAGDIDLVLEAGLKPYDYLSLIPIVEQSGGVITNWKGGELDGYSEGQVLASANMSLHKQALEIIK